MDISFVIPCYCSSKTLPFVIAEVKMAMEKIDISDYEIILVNDCSPDEGKTWQKELIWLKMADREQQLWLAYHRLKENWLQ